MDAIDTGNRTGHSQPGFQSSHLASLLMAKVGFVDRRAMEKRVEYRNRDKTTGKHTDVWARVLKVKGLLTLCTE